MTGKKVLICQIILLDDRVPSFQVPLRSFGNELYQLVFKELQLLESDYFGLEYKTIDNVDSWLDKEKPILHQVASEENLSFKFRVKFYTPDPTLLEDEFTRYQFALQIRQDLATGHLQCSINTAALLSAYIAQSELGDFLPGEYTDHAYLKCISFVPHQTEELEKRIMEYHKTFTGQTPSEADLNLLDTARKTDFYGVALNPAKDHEGVLLSLAVVESGIFVFQNNQRINTFSWAKIRKLSFRRKKFLIKLHPAAETAHYKDLVEFVFGSRNQAKAFWKTCVEHHSFFRCREIKKIPRNRHPLLSRGSSFRYTGRTQTQLLDHVKDSMIKGRTFDRTMSLRTTGGSHKYTTTRLSTTLNFSPRQPAADLSLNRTQNTPSSTLHPPFKDGKMSMADMQSSETSILKSPSLTKDRNFSSPSLGSTIMSPSDALSGSADQHRLSRSPEYQNIPEKLQLATAPVDIFTRGLDIHEEFLNDAPKSLHSNKDICIRSEEQHCTDDSTQLSLPPVLNQSELDILRSRTHPGGDFGDKLAAHHSAAGDGAPEPLLVCPSIKLPPAVFKVHGNSESLSFTVQNGTADNEEGRKIEHDAKKKRYPTDKAFFIAKELVMTERTYHKDLEILTKTFRQYVQPDTASESVLAQLFSLVDPMYAAHSLFLQDLEMRLIAWEGKSHTNEVSDVQRIADIWVKHNQQLSLYRHYLDKLEKVLLDLSACASSNRELTKQLQEFEMEKVCYLPVYSLLLKPAHRLLHYESVLARLLSHYTTSSLDYKDCKSANGIVLDLLGKYRSVISELENLEKLTELQQDVVGIESLVQRGRYFIREGCLQKFSRKGYQQRLFLLLSDVLLFTSRTSSSLLQFKVHGQMSLNGMTLEESDPKTGVANSFSVYGGNRCLIVAATSQEEKDKWLEDLNFAISVANADTVSAPTPPQLTNSMTSSTSETDVNETGSPDKEATQQHKANTTMHVCWHRNTSVSIKDLQSVIKHQLSGYLMRKFKNSNGWQKLWVVFTNFCLFFYKTHQDEAPLASLPLLGYSVGTPSASDGIQKDNVFKLVFKNHVYFFRAESDYTFQRWIEVVNSATQSARRTRTFSRMDSVQS